MRGLHNFARAAAIAVALLATPAVAEPAATTPAPAVAPAPSVSGVAADMTLDAARAATPAVQWQNELSLHSGKPTAIWADAAFTLDSQPYRVSLQPLPSGTARLKLHSNEQVEKAKVCRARVVALAAHFDVFFDKMEATLSPLDAPPPPRMSFSYNRLPGGAGYVSATPHFVDDGRDFDTLEAGRNARIHEIEYNDTDDLEWKTGQRAKTDYPYALDLLGSFYKGDGALPSTCVIEATVTRYPPDRQWPGRPSFDVLDTASTKLVAKPSAALLHNSLEGVELPPEGLSLTYRCDVNRSNGRVLYCAPEGRERGKEEIERAARARLYAMAFDPAKLDPDNDLPLRADITIKLLPSERLKPEALKAVAPPPMPVLSSTSAVKVPPRYPVWTRAPTGEEMSRHYPSDALRQELEARVVATCTIANDLSLVCVGFEINPPEHTMFEAAAKKILALYRAAPKLKNGDDAPGTVVRVPILFKIADEPAPVVNP